MPEELVDADERGDRFTFRLREVHVEQAGEGRSEIQD